MVKMQLQETNGSLAEKKPTVVFVLGEYTLHESSYDISNIK